MRFLTSLFVVFVLAQPAIAASNFCAQILAKSASTLAFSPRHVQVNHLSALNEAQRTRFYRIQELANREGVTIVIPDFHDLSSLSRETIFELFGTKVVVVKEGDTRGRKIKGVVLHLGVVTKLIRAVRGDLNPTHTNERSLKKIEIGDKWLEYVLTEKTAPGEDLMAKSISVANEPAFREYLVAELPSVQKVLSQALARGRNSFTLEDRIVLEGFIRKFFDLTESLLGPAFVKYKEEARTGDTKDTIMTFKTDPKKMVDTFEGDFFASKAEVSANENDLGHKYFLEALKEKEHNATNLFKSLLFKPQDIFVQQKLNLATYAGYTAEIRVDVLNGIPITASTRYGYHFFPPELLQEALAFTAKFFARLPPAWRNMSGGVDVAFVAAPNGGLVPKVSHVEGQEQTLQKDFMEYNFGADSGFIYAKGETVEANEWLSTILGRPTPLIQKFEVSFLSGIRGQVAFMRSLRPQVRASKNGIKDISRAEYGSWLAYRHMQRWNGTRHDVTNDGREGAEQIRQRIAAAFAGHLRGTPELQEILNSLDLYISRLP